ncbi:MAG: rRNA maturation RNase YbeY [Eubacteriales bacterium]
MTKVYYKCIAAEKPSRSLVCDMKKCVRYTVQSYYPTTSFEVNVTVCGNDHIRALNAEYRGIDRETDVLSFPMGDFDLPAGPRMLGDIVISLDKAVSQSREYGHSLRRELCFLCVHAALHLLGFDHEEGEGSEREMEEKQEEILTKLGINR